MSEISDKYIRRSLRVNRVSVGESVKSSKLLKEVHEKINFVIEKRISPTSTAADLKKAKREISVLLRSFYSDEFTERIERDSKKIVELETVWNFKQLTEIGDGIAINGVNWHEAAEKAWTKPYNGKTFTEWFRDEGVLQTSKINKTISGAFVNGLSISETTSLINDLAKRADKNIRTLTRSAMLNASSQARAEMLEANNDILDGRIWSATLDIRTTPHICGVRDGKEYDNNYKPVGHSLPWGAGAGRIHFNCRSVEIPKIKGVKITANRPAISAGDNYQRGDNLTNRGTVRKPTKRNREKGIFEIEGVTNKTKYEGWLRRQPKSFVADALGSNEKATLFKNGESLFSITNDPFGKPLTIESL